MSLITPYLLLVLAAFGAFMTALLAVSLRCWGMEVPRGTASDAKSPAKAGRAPLREAA